MANFSPGWNFGLPTGLKFCCDYMTNFSPGVMFKIGREKVAGKRFTFTTQAVRMNKVIFQPGLKFECAYMRFFSRFDRTEISSPVCETGLEISARTGIQPGLKLSSCNRKRLFKKICSGSRAEISARLIGLKFAM